MMMGMDWSDVLPLTSRPAVLVTVALYWDPLRGTLLRGTCLSLTSAE